MVPAMEPIPSATFDPEDYTPDEAPRAWRRFFQSLHHVTPLQAPGQRFSSRSSSWMIDDLMVGYAKFGAQTMERKLSSEIVQAAACKFLMGWRYRSGQAKVYHAGDAVDLHPGYYCLIDYDRGCHTIAAESDVLAILLPHQAVGYAPEKHPPRFMIPVDTPQGALLSDFHESLVKNAPMIKINEAAAISKGVKAVYASVIENLAEHATPAVSKWDDIRRFIDEQIFEPDLTVATLTEKFGVSRATLYRQLAMSGGLQSYIAGRRLDYAFRHLTIGGPLRGRISEIAARCGYTSTNQFSRAFSRHFGFAPSAVLGAFSKDSSDARPGAPGENTLWDMWHSADFKARP